MILYDGIYAAADGANTAYLAERDNLPAFVQEKLDPFMGDNFWNVSWVDLIAAFVETVYANRSAVSVELMAVAAGVAAVIAAYGFHNSLDGRVAGIGLALRRDSGEVAEEGFTWPEASEDPEASEGYVAPAAPPPPPPPPPAPPPPPPPAPPPPPPPGNGE